MSVSILIFPSHKKAARLRIEVLRSGKSARSAPKSGEAKRVIPLANLSTCVYRTYPESNKINDIGQPSVGRSKRSRINGQYSDNQYIFYHAPSLVPYLCRYLIGWHMAWKIIFLTLKVWCREQFSVWKRERFDSSRDLYVHYVHEQSTTNEPFRIRIICSSYNRLPADILQSISLGLYLGGVGEYA